MGLLSIVSFALFCVPVFVTFGIYFGADYQNILSCGLNCGEPGGNLGALPSIPGVLVGHPFCSLDTPVVPAPGDYILNPNQWGNENGDEGSLCILITSDEVPSGYASQFQIEWSFRTPAPDTRPVHAFPNAAMSAGQFPVQIGGMKGLAVDVSWNYQTLATDLTGNVCIDMFISSNADTSDDTENADFEVMVWFAQFGAADPLGNDNPILAERTVDGTTFALYRAQNQFGQLTFTWLARQNTEVFTGDLMPLLTNLNQFNGPVATDYIGYVSFGSEAFYASYNATLHVPRLEMKILK